MSTFGAIDGDNIAAGLHASTINNYFGQRPQDANAQTSPPKPCAIVPFPPDPRFVDRPEIMKWVGEKCAFPGARAALVGLGGVGKSQIAIHYSYKVRENSPDTWVFWVVASSRERFEAEYGDIAERLCLPRRNDPGINILKLVYDWLRKEENGRWFMVLDNADDVNVLFPKDGNGIDTEAQLDSFLPMSINGSILITSRNRNVVEKLVGGYGDICGIDAMHDDDALQVLQKKLVYQPDEKQARDLVRALNNIPLAIDQAAAFINRRAPRMTISTYLDDFCNSPKRRSELLRTDATNLWRDQTSLNTVASTWQATFEQIRRDRPSAADLLSLMSFFNPQGIPEFVLIKFICKNREDGAYNSGDSEDDYLDDDRKALEEDLEVLQAYSLVAVTKETDMFEMHSLVQFCTQDWLSSTGGRHRWKSVFLQVICEAYPAGNYENWNECEKLGPHVELIIREKPEKNEAEYWARLARRVGHYWDERGRCKEAERLVLEAANIFKEVKGSEAEETLECLQTLSKILISNGKYKEAEHISRQVLNARENTLGTEHSDTLSVLYNLAIAEFFKGRLGNAEKMFRKVLSVREKSLGKEHEETLTCLNGVGLTLAGQKKYEEAETIYRELVSTNEAVRGGNIPTHLNSFIICRHRCMIRRSTKRQIRFIGRYYRQRKGFLGMNILTRWQLFGTLRRSAEIPTVSKKQLSSTRGLPMGL